MKKYNHLSIEKKWQNIWEKTGAFKALDPGKTKKKKFYGLIEFPYPSGEGLHVGHPRPYIGMDIIARKRRMQGYNVLYPIGWDAFGLPAENYAIKTKTHPAKITKKNSDNFRRQIKMLGTSFDWSREINTTDPAYYKWTQWMFLQFYKHGLAYKATMTINWCPKDKIGLANEEVIGGCCERCGTKVEKREKEQWMLAITKYADRLDSDLEGLDYLEKIKLQQKNWIGKKTGAELDFTLSTGDKVTVFTTRPDTLYGVSALVLSPEHPLVQTLPVTNQTEVEAYVQQAQDKEEIDRTDAHKEKTGVMLQGVTALSPVGHTIPVFIADYVLMGFGTGAVMAVPAHDERDFAFAQKYDLPVTYVIASLSVREGQVFTGHGTLINSEKYNGLESEKAGKLITKDVGGKLVTKYKLRDWVFSRQRYWGEPIPLVYCDRCGTVPVPEKQLPVLLPKVTSYEPTETGESPLAAISSWVNTRCPACGGKARRETDTMPNWAGSSWYFLRYVDPKNTKTFADIKKLKYWMPVDWYNGGMEHTTLHLLYSRFWNKFLYDHKLVPTSEPYAKRTSHGFILAANNEKMSKSRGNVVNPDDIVKTYGADTLRVYEMFMGPFSEAISWNEDNMLGVRRFLERVWKMPDMVSTQKKALRKEITLLVSKTIDKVSTDIESMSFNTAISSLMVLLNTLEKEPEVHIKYFDTFLILLSVFAPHIAEELWSIHHKKSIFLEKWPTVKAQDLIEDTVTIVVQINGKMRAQFTLERDASEKIVREKAESIPDVTKWFGEKTPTKVIYVKNKLINFVVV